MKIQAHSRDESLVRVAVSVIARKLGRASLDHELFDAGWQLGVAYQNPITERWHAVRFELDNDPSIFLPALQDAVRQLRERTQ